MSQERDEHLPPKPVDKSDKRQHYVFGETALDRDTLHALQDAQQHADTPLLDNTPLADADCIEDNTPLLNHVSSPDNVSTRDIESSMSVNAPPALPVGACIQGGSDATDNDSTNEDGEQGKEPPLSQDRLDELLAQHQEADDAPPTSIPIQEKSTPEPPKQEAKTEDAAEVLSQENLDALIAGETQSTPPEPPKQEAIADDAAEALSQEDLDALIAASDTSAESTESTTSIAPTDTEDTTLSQEDLDALLAATAADTENAEDSDATISQQDIDSLLTDSADDQALDNKSIDSLILDTETNGESDVSISATDVDSLLNALEEDATTTDDSATPDISQSMIDALVSDAEDDVPAGAVASENLAAAATTSTESDGLLSQDDLDALIKQSRGKDRERQHAKQEAIETAIQRAKTGARPSTPGTKRPQLVRAYIRKELPKIATSLVVALLVGTLTYWSLNMFQDRNPSWQMLSKIGGTGLTIAMEEAEAFLNRNDYSAAIAVLKEPIENAEKGTQRTDAEFLLAEARYRNFSGEPGTPRYIDILNTLDGLVDKVPTHPKAHRAIYWKAKLYARENYLPYSAQDEYADIIEYYSSAPDIDDILIDASKLALSLEDPLAAGSYSRHLLQQFPGSTFTAQAEMIMGDAYAMVGAETDARTRYVEIAERQPNTSAGAKAFLNLAILAYKNQDYSLTIHHLQTRLETSTTTDGNDEVYLLLAQALRNEHRLEEARDALNDFLNFFPESSVTPRAYIELSKILDDLGQRQQALQLARQAAIRYPEHPQVLQNKGQLLGLAGNPLGAAQALIQADEAGLNDPAVLLSAARYYAAATMLENARDTYATLMQKYPGTRQAITGGIEAARTLYAIGQITDAVNRLEDLALATKGTDQYLSALLAMNEIYRDLGLYTRVIEISQEIAKLSQEPEILASAATALLQADAIQPAQPIIDNLDLSRIRNEAAYDLLMRYGTKLLEVNPALGLEKMEDAYLGYPESRTLENDQILLETYLAVDRSAAARRMIMELKSHVDAHPENAAHLVRGAIAWGDYLYDRGDFRAATNAFQMAIVAAKNVSPRDTEKSTGSFWAKFQRANALLELSEFDESLRLYDELALADVPWASDASMKARFARLEKRRRGLL